MTELILVFVGACLLALLLTRQMVRIAEKYDLIDNENERTLHSGRKPRAGGVAIVGCLLLVHGGWVLSRGLPSIDLLSWWGVGYGIAILGLLDDIFKLSVFSRLVVQVILVVLFSINCVLWVGTGTVLSFFVAALFIVGVVWAINGANFMDGVDGLLATQAAVISVTLCLITANTLADPVAVTLVAMSGACLGFLYWNWQPSKIFLGDIGSCFIGLNLVAFVTFSADGSVSHFLAGLILLVPLFTDATLTLLKRIFCREPFWRAHRSHVYQQLIVSGSSHRLISSVLGCVTAVIFAPLAYFAWNNPNHSSATFMVGCIVGIVMWAMCHLLVASRLNTQA